ncbi:MAG: porin family protein [Thermoanaerobaculia bacterium]|nr:MAG: porin family protein [Thermoanaerobaculia bacterium]MBZ0101745.1 hypothetical protein [Thermoanaerobaculia bacterium]
MSRFLRTASLALLTVSLTAVPALAGEHRIGFGYHYFETLDDIEIDDLGAIEDSGNSIVVSYQYLPGGLLRFEADIEYWEDGFGGVTGEEAYAPQIYLLAGRGFYGGVGVGMTQSDGFFSGDDWSDPWYAARVGVDLLLLPRIHLDINANYRADAFNDLDQAESDAITLGASVRFGF